MQTVDNATRCSLITLHIYNASVATPFFKSVFYFCRNLCTCLIFRNVNVWERITDIDI